MIDHLKHMAKVRPDGLDRTAAAWALAEIERLRETIVSVVNRNLELLEELKGVRESVGNLEANLVRHFNEVNEAEEKARAEMANQLNGQDRY